MTPNHFYIYRGIPNGCRSEIYQRRPVAVFSDMQQRKWAQIRCPIYTAALNCCGHMSLIPYAPICLVLVLVLFSISQSSNSMKKDTKNIDHVNEDTFTFSIIYAMRDKSCVSYFTCRITLRINAFTGAVKISWVPRKHHKTMPPLVNIVNKSNIFL